MKEEIVAKGIVLKTMPYKENDCILTVYFEEYGKLSLIATGLRKPKSKNIGACQPLMYSEFTLFLRPGLSKLIRAVPINHFRYLQNDLQAMACATFLVEYFYRGIEENEPNSKHTHQLLATLKHLNDGYPPLLVYLFNLAFILKDCGSAIMVDHCVYCNQTQVVSISERDGGFICQNHLKEDDPLISKEVLRLIRYVNRLDIDKMDIIDATVSTLQEGKRIMDNFLDEYCPIRFSSRKFIQ